MATQRQTRYLMNLIEDNGYSIQQMDISLCKRFRLPVARMSTEKYLLDHVTVDKASEMIDELKEYRRW
jgi:hypothetical protein